MGERESMVELVARKLREVVKPSPACLAGITDDDARVLARAAIMAMREPNDTMRTAGGLAFEKASFEEQKMVFDAAADAWQAMIDAALAEQPDPSPHSPGRPDPAHNRQEPR